MNPQTWKVGELAKLTGLTVRTLHHYDQIGLLSPSLYSDTGHRRYTGADIGRLHHILSLKGLGFSLDDIKELIDNLKFQPEQARVFYSGAIGKAQNPKRADRARYDQECGKRMA